MTLTITRPRQYADMLRRYRVIVDGHRSATIRAGQAIVIELPHGRHRIEAAIDWARSNPIDIEAPSCGHCRLEVGSNVAGWRLLLALAYITVWSDRYLYLKEAGPPAELKPASTHVF